MVRQMDELVTGDDGGDLYRLDRRENYAQMGVDEDITKSRGGDEVEELTHGVSLLADESVHVTPGFFQVRFRVCPGPYHETRGRYEYVWLIETFRRMLSVAVCRDPWHGDR